MTKDQEMSYPASCWNNSKDQEMLFVLCGRDAAAPRAVYAWIASRIELGLNKPGDRKLVEAEHAAARMDADRLAARLAAIDAAEARRVEQAAAEVA